MTTSSQKQAQRLLDIERNASDYAKDARRMTELMSGELHADLAMMLDAVTALIARQTWADFSAVLDKLQESSEELDNIYTTEKE